ncbi:Der GTPase-activating protein YihI [Vibrio hippocampi]|uniref:Der GTPase-activating protein YihI n=1 Tax=Vibrio hippocampi TaxID=654686 RepID=A0ABM8ZKH5_9VIBR|nr:Der GTPase-activating protein YihI [Vibrio hippocampi]CAH0527317.1 Der GTPase-activating protein YihI [Vibrio hippocampi]
MSRTKKSRKPGSSPEPVIVTRNRTESDVEGRLRKRLKKRKGQKSGSRHSQGSGSATPGSKQGLDPRLGSKKKIPLIVEAKKKPSKQERRVSAEKELELLENDAQLNVLLDRLDNGDKLGLGLQKYVDEKLDRIEILMKQLGLFEEEEPEIEEPEMEEKVVKPSKKRKDDAELLADFEDLDLNQFKN